MSVLQGVDILHFQGLFGVSDFTVVNEHLLRLQPGSDVNVSLLTSYAKAPWAPFAAYLGTHLSLWDKINTVTSSVCFFQVRMSKYLLPVITTWDPGSTIWMFSVAVRAPAF